MRKVMFAWMITAGVLLCADSLAFAQGTGGGRTGGATGGGTGGGTGGTSGTFTGGGTGGTGGVFTGGGAGNTFTGGGTGMTGTTGTGRGGTTQVGATSLLGRSLGNPYAAGLGTGTSSGTFARPNTTYPWTLAFGQPTVSNTATVSRTSATGTGIGTGVQGQAARTNAQGANSFGVRRAPNYVVEPVFDVPERMNTETVRDDVQGVIARSSRLPSRDRIQVTTTGNTVTLSGQVRDEREKRLAEAIVRLSPGVREVRNNLRTQ